MEVERRAAREFDLQGGARGCVPWPRASSPASRAEQEGRARCTRGGAILGAAASIVYFHCASAEVARAPALWVRELFFLSGREGLAGWAEREGESEVSGEWIEPGVGEI